MPVGPAPAITTGCPVIRRSPSRDAAVPTHTLHHAPRPRRTDTRAAALLLDRYRRWSYCTGTEHNVSQKDSGPHDPRLPLALLAIRAALADQLIGARVDDPVVGRGRAAGRPPHPNLARRRAARRRRPRRTPRARAGRTLTASGALLPAYARRHGRVTLQTIADHVGVSRMTVSNAFSRPDQLSDGLRERILDAARELGYVGPRPAGARAGPRHDRRGRRPAHRLAAVRLHQRRLDRLPRGGHRRARTDRPRAHPAVDVEHGDVVPARDAAMDGAVVYACDPDTTAANWLFQRGLPLVTVDQEPVPGRAERHRRRPWRRPRRRLRTSSGWGTAGSGSSPSGTAPRGWRPTPPRTPSPGGTSHANGWPATSTSWAGRLRPCCTPSTATTRTTRTPPRWPCWPGRRPSRPTAVLCHSDVLALGVLRAAEELGLAVPGDLSVVGFDDSPLARRVRPALTTVRQDVDAKGKAAAARSGGRWRRPGTGAATGEPGAAGHRAGRQGEHRPGGPGSDPDG